MTRILMMVRNRRCVFVQRMIVMVTFKILQQIWHETTYTYGSILPGREFGAYLCPYFVGENSTPVSIIWVQIKFRKICWMDRRIFSNFPKFFKYEKCIQIFQKFSNMKNLFKFSNFSEKFDFFSSILNK